MPRASSTKSRRSSLSVKIHSTTLGGKTIVELRTSACLFSGLLHRTSRPVVRDVSSTLVWAGAQKLGACHFGEVGTVRRLRPLTAAPGFVQRLRNLNLPRCEHQSGRIVAQRIQPSEFLPSSEKHGRVPARSQKHPPLHQRLEVKAVLVQHTPKRRTQLPSAK